MRYRDLKIVERRRSEKGSLRIKAAPGEINYPSAVSDKRESAVRELQKYATGYDGIALKDLYVSYTSVNKLGINPRSGYNTPIGIYSYPLEYLLNKISAAGTATAADYMGEQPNIWVFTPKSPDNGLNLSDYSEQRYVKDITKLYNYLLKNGWSDEDFKNVVGDALNTMRPPVGLASPWAARLWWVCSNLANANVKVKKYEKVRDIFKVGDWVTSKKAGFSNVLPYESLSNKIIAINHPKATVLSTTSSSSEERDVYLTDLVKTSAPTGADATFELGDYVKILSSGKAGVVEYFIEKTVNGFDVIGDELAIKIEDTHDVEVHKTSEVEKTDKAMHDFKIGDLVKFKTGSYDFYDLIIAGFPKPTIANIKSTDGDPVGKVNVSALLHATEDLPDNPPPPVQPKNKTPTAPTNTPPNKKSNIIALDPKTLASLTPGQLKDFNELVKKGLNSGEITYFELGNVFPTDDITGEQLDDIINYFNSLSINLVPQSTNSMLGLSESKLFEESSRRDPAKPETVEWNRLFRVLGYQYVADPAGSGTIHPSEKTQAVFFSANYITPIERIKNTDTSKSTTVNPFENLGITGKYDPVAAEKYLKANYDTVYLDSLPYGIVIKSAKLQKTLLKYNSAYLKHMSNVYPEVLNEVAELKLDEIQRYKKDPNAVFDNPYNLMTSIKPLLTPESKSKLKNIVKDNADLAYSYILYVSHELFPEAEAVLSTDPDKALEYVQVTKQPFPAAEPEFAESAYHASEYAKILGKRFIEGEPAIMTSPKQALDYAVNVLKQPWPEAEPVIKTDIYAYEVYREQFPVWGNIEELKGGEIFEFKQDNTVQLVSTTGKEAAYNFGKPTAEAYNYSTNKLVNLRGVGVELIEPNRFGFAVGQQVSISGEPCTIVGWDDDNGEYGYITGTLNKIMKMPGIYKSLPSVYPKKLPPEYAVKKISLKELKEQNPDAYVKTKSFKVGDDVIVDNKNSKWNGKTGVVRIFDKDSVIVRVTGAAWDIIRFDKSELDHYHY
jgi:hypothetical protein